MKFCSFGSRYAGTGWQLEKTQSLFFVFLFFSRREHHCCNTVVNTAKTNGGMLFWLDLLDLKICFKGAQGRQMDKARYCCHTAATSDQTIVMKIV